MPILICAHFTGEGYPPSKSGQADGHVAAAAAGIMPAGLCKHDLIRQRQAFYLCGNIYYRCT